MKKAPYFVIILLCCTAFPLAAQKKIKITGTGNTTGNIANLTIHNSGNTAVEINGQTAFIPSGGQYQPYIVTIPKTTVPPGTITIPLTGYCADVTAPPVPSGEAMPPIDEWIAIDQVTRPGPGEAPVNIVEQTVPPFSVSDIPMITVSSGFTPKPPPAIPEIQLTWPGSDIIVGGVLDPVKDPESTAPVLIEALQNISNAFDSLRGIGVINTPFSGDPQRERESVIQQTFWIYAAGLTGERYQKENFTTKVIDQYEHNVGITVAKIPESERNKLDEGVDDFWNTFMATGVEAKIISATTASSTSSNGMIFLPYIDVPVEAIAAQELPLNHMIAQMNDMDKAVFSMATDSLKVDTTGCNSHDIITKLVEVKGQGQAIITLPDGIEVEAKVGIVIPENSNVTTDDNIALIFDIIICKPAKPGDVNGLRQKQYCRITVSSNTEIKFDKFSLQASNVVTRVQLKEGETRIKVTDERQDYRTDMKVATPNTSSGVSGTDFIVRTNSAGDAILVANGSVVVRSAGNSGTYKIVSGKKFTVNL